MSYKDILKEVRNSFSNYCLELQKCTPCTLLAFFELFSKYTIMNFPLTSFSTSAFTPLIFSLSNLKHYFWIYKHFNVDVFVVEGLLAKWHAVVEDSIIYRERLKRLRSGSNLKVFSLNDMQTAFYILSIGLFCCSVLFLCEIVYQQKYSCKHIKTMCTCNLKLKRF